LKSVETMIFNPVVRLVRRILLRDEKCNDQILPFYLVSCGDGSCVYDMARIDNNTNWPIIKLQDAIGNDLICAREDSKGGTYFYGGIQNENAIHH